MQAKKLAQLVNEYRNRPDDRRCFNCESLGSTYYVPTFSIFVCTQCSGVHMQFGHRVKSVTLADYKPEEVEQMRDGGNQVAAYRYLARYTPDKDLKKPLDRNPQHIRVWIQTVFMDKRFYSADAPVPRRPSDAGSSAAGTALHSTVRASSGALSRTSSTREGAHSVSPVPVSPTPSAGGHQQHLQQSGSPPVRDVRELLGDKATALHVGPKAPSSSSQTTAVTSAPPPLPAAAAAAPASPPAAVPAKAQAVAFDPFAAPDVPPATPTLPAVAAVSPAATPAAAAPLTAPVAAGGGSMGGWAAFAQGLVAAPGQVAQAAVPQAAAPASSTSSGVWATFDDDSGIPQSFAAPLAASAVATGATGSPAAAGSRPVGVAPAATAAAAAAVAQEARVSDAGAAASTPKGGKPPAKELAADLFSEVTYVQPGLAAGGLQHPGLLSAVGGRQSLPGMQQAVGGVAGGPGVGYGMQPQQQQVPSHQAWAMQQQAALAWQHQQHQHQQQLQQQQLLQQQQQQMYGMHHAEAAGLHFPAATPPQHQQPGMMAAWRAVPGQHHGMNGVTYSAAAGASMGWQQQQQQQHPVGSSGLPSSSTNELATAAAGVTQKNAFADLVDLKKALPNAGGASTTALSGTLSPGYGMPPIAAGSASGLAYSMPGGGAAAGLPSTVGSAPQQPPVYSQPVAYQQQVQHGLQGPYGSQAPPTAHSAAAVQDSNNPFA